MSRIAGIVARNCVENSQSRLGEMMGAWRADAAWSSHRETSGQTMFGWSGWQSPNIAAVNGLIAVMDGHIYNRAELGSADNDVALLITLYQKHGFANALRK